MSLFYLKADSATTGNWPKKAPVFCAFCRRRFPIAKNVQKILRNWQVHN